MTTDSIETSENEAFEPAPGAIQVKPRKLTLAQIIGMIHKDLPPATAHFLLLEAKPLLLEAQEPVGVVDEGDEGLFADFETPDGVKVKRGDNLYTAAPVAPASTHRFTTDDGRTVDVPHESLPPGATITSAKLITRNGVEHVLQPVSDAAPALKATIAQPEQATSEHTFGTKKRSLQATSEHTFGTKKRSLLEGWIGVDKAPADGQQVETLWCWGLESWAIHLGTAQYKVLVEGHGGYYGAVSGRPQDTPSYWRPLEGEAAPAIDWQKLLEKYMAHIFKMEGVDYTSGGSLGKEFSEAEESVLLAIDAKLQAMADEQEPT